VTSRDVLLVLAHRVGTVVRPAGAEGWSVFDENGTTRLAVDAAGRARGMLAVGPYTIAVASLPQRTTTGMDWPPLSAATMHVAVGAGASIDVVVSRPRLVEIDLGAAWATSEPWVLDAGFGRRRFAGRRGRIWLTDAAHGLRVVDLHDRELGSTHLPSGRDPITVSVPMVAGR
jgi:hypothetical protein